MKVCDVCKNELEKPILVEFSFESSSRGNIDWKNSRKVEACSIKCFEKWYEKFMNWYRKKVAEIV